MSVRVQDAPDGGLPDEPAASGHTLLEGALAQLLSEAHAGLFDRIESALVHAAFAHAGRNQVRAAKVLGITRNMLRTQLKRHGLLGKGDDDAGEVDEAAASISESAGATGTGAHLDAGGREAGGNTPLYSQPA